MVSGTKSILDTKRNIAKAHIQIEVKMSEYILQRIKRQNQEILSWFLFGMGILGITLLIFKTSWLPLNPTLFAITYIVIAVLSVAAIIKSFKTRVIPI